MQSRWQVFLEQFGDPVVLLHEDDVHGREEGVLVHPHLSGHEVVNLFRLQKCSDWPDVQLQEEEQRVGGACKLCYYLIGRSCVFRYNYSLNDWQ